MIVTQEYKTKVKKSVEKFYLLFCLNVENFVESVENSVGTVERYLESTLYLGINRLFTSKNGINRVFFTLKKLNVEKLKIF